ncbi:hypothetical protein [Cupriavidus basilensis]
MTFPPGAGERLRSLGARSSKQGLGRRALKAALVTIEQRLFRAREPFGVFIRDGGVVMIKTSTQLFADECKRAARRGEHSHLVGVYDGRACLQAVQEDLQEFTR